MRWTSRITRYHPVCVAALSSALLFLLHLRRRQAQAVGVAEEEHLAVLALSTFVGLNPLAPSGALVECPDKSDWSTLNVTSVVLAHDRLDSLGGFVGVVEGDGGDVVVQDVSLDDAVEEVTTDETEFAVNGCGGTTSKVPRAASVVRERGVGVLEVGDSDCESVSNVDSLSIRKRREMTYQASGSPKGKGRCTTQSNSTNRSSCRRTQGCCQ